MGRHSKLTPDVQTKIVAALKAGAYFDDAIAYAGVGKSTAYHWLKRGEPGTTVRGDARYRAFREAVEQARASARVEAVLVIKQAARAGQWQASAWFLERTEPGKWGRKDRVTLEGDGTKPLLVAVRDEHAEQVSRSIRDAIAGVALKAPDSETIASNGHGSTNGHVE
jgi:hypothetical protein